MHPLPLLPLPPPPLPPPPLPLPRGSQQMRPEGGGAHACHNTGTAATAGASAAPEAAAEAAKHREERHATVQQVSGGSARVVHRSIKRQERAVAAEASARLTSTEEAMAVKLSQALERVAALEREGQAAAEQHRVALGRAEAEAEW